MDISLDDDTIAAIVTAPGRGGVGIVRLSGKKALLIGEIISGKQLLPRLATFCHFRNHRENALIDNGIAIFFPAPHSFTGEDVLEFQIHGSPVVLDLLLAAAFGLGARMARPGEFSERAFLNNKMDLAQAEAVADLIAADTTVAARSALASLQGTFSKEINILIEQLVELRAYVEAALDFPEEEINFLATGKVAEQMEALEQQLLCIATEAHHGALITEGMTLVIAGKPNAGKSSLLNALVGRDTAIVTPLPGTTRDVLREHIQIDGMPLHLIDTAGFRDSQDPIEQEGIRRAVTEIQKADRILLIVDSNEPASKTLSLADIWPTWLCELPGHIPLTTVFNKCDLSGMSPARDGYSVILSAKTGKGINLLKQHLKDVMGFYDGSSGRFSARRRHLQALQKAMEYIKLGKQQLSAQSGGELLAEELRLAQRELEIITGHFTPDDLLDKIFRDFCIGK